GPADIDEMRVVPQAEDARLLRYLLDVAVLESHMHRSDLQGMKRPEHAPCPVLWSKRRFFCPSFRAAENIDVREHAYRRRVAAVDHLVGLALAAVLRAMHFEGARIADGSQASPECRRYATV